MTPIISTYIEMAQATKDAIATYLDLHKELDQDQLIALAIAAFVEASK